MQPNSFYMAEENAEENAEEMMSNTWESLVEMLVRKAKRLGVQDVDALDFAQTSVCRLLQRYRPSKWRDPLEDIPTKEAFKIAAVICTNLVRDVRRSAFRKVEIAVNGTDFSAIASDRQTSFSDRSGANLLRSQLARVMPDSHRHVIEHSLTGLTQSQIAERLKMPLGTVKSILYRAKKRASAARDGDVAAVAAKKIIDLKSTEERGHV